MEEEELLAIFDRAGRQVGFKPRAEVHRDGDWHWLVFVWAARRDEDGRLRVLMQLRGRPGDPYNGCLDAPAGGHVAALEGHREGGLREFEEEVGIALEEGDLVGLGERFFENPTGVCQRVIEHFYLCVRPVRLEEVAFSREVDGFVEVDLEGFAQMLDGEREGIEGRVRRAGEEGIGEIEVTGELLAAYSEGIIADFRRSMRAVRSYMEKGEVDPALWI